MYIFINTCKICIFINIDFNIYAHTFLGILTLFKVYGSCCASFVFISYVLIIFFFFVTNLFVYHTSSSPNISNGG